MANGLLQNPGAVSEEDPTAISQEAQDVAKAQGVSYQDVAKTQTDMETPEYSDYNAEKAGTQLDDTVDIKSGLSYVDQDKSTVAGQLGTLLDSDSQYIKQAEAKGREEAAARGLLSSSISAGAARREAINAALPIAQQDAQTYAKAQSAQQAADYNIETIQGEAIVSGEMVKQKASIDQANQNINNAFQASMAGADAQNKAWMQDMQNSYNESMKELEFEQNKILQMEQISAEKASQIRDQSSAIMQNYQISVENMLTDPDFLAMGSQAVNNAVNQMQQLARNSIMFLGASSGVDLDDFVDAYLADISVL